MRTIIAAASLLALAACGMNGADTDSDDQEAAAAADRMSVDENAADTMRSNDPAPGEMSRVDIPDPEDRPTMQLQVVLDRQGFGPGVIDGKMGMSTSNAIEGFQEANGLETTGKLDDETKAALDKWKNIGATRVVTIPQDWGAKTYEDIPDDPAEQAKMQRLGYESLDERIAERFHTTVEVLKMLNPGGKPAGMDQARTDPSRSSSTTPSPTASPSGSPAPSPSGSLGTSASGSSSGSDSLFQAGQMVRVPNIGADHIVADKVQDKGWQQTLASLGVGTEQPHVAKIVVDKSGDWLKGYDEAGKLVAMFTVTTGSTHDPLPLGTWGITGISHNPPFSYDPDLFWDVPNSEQDRQLPPGPNGPVGIVWIDLTKEHYGIHGTSAPSTIGRVQSHGCVRLTNWDAARLAEMVDQKTKVVFQA